MGTAFVSHSSKDKYFVDLLIELLRYHHIQIWYDSHDIKPGTKYLKTIEEGLQKANTFIVVISENSLNSKWIVREITSFTTSKPDAMILPVVIEKVDMDEVFKGLEDYQAILFYGNMLNGFRELLNCFGKEFLPVQERRQSEDRRSDERRQFYDRRKSPIIQRLRKGFWKCYSSETEINPFDDFPLLPSKRIELSEILLSEIVKYEYFDGDGNQHEFTQKDLDKIIFEVWEDMASREYVTAINTIESIAEKIYQNFSEVKPIHRRQKKRREGKKRRQDE